MNDRDDVISDEVLRQRIRQLMEVPEPRTGISVDRLLRHPLTTLVIGFVLTGIVGTAVAASIQQRSDEARRNAERREARRESALSTVDTVGVSLNRTFYQYGEYWDAIVQSLDVAELESRLQRFDSARALFESRRIIDAARVEVHLGSNLRVQYEMIADSLQHLAGGFARARQSRRLIEAIAPSVENLKQFVSRFLLAMVVAADSMAAGPSRGT